MRAGRGAALALVGALSLIGQATLAVSLAHAATSRNTVQQLTDRLPASLVPRQFLMQVRQELPPRALPPANGTTGDVILLDRLDDPRGLERTLRDLLAAGSLDDLRLSVPGGHARLGTYSIGSSETLDGHLLVLRGDADIFGQLNGNVVALDGDIIVHQGATIRGDALALGGRIREVGGTIAGQAVGFGTAVERGSSVTASPLARFGINAAGLSGVFLTLTLLGFLLLVFAKPNLDIVSDTVAHSFGRSFMVGLMGQVLLLPTFGMLVVGLILSVVGALLVPFVVVVYALLAIIGIVGGFLAVAHAMGEKQTRRRMAQGLIASPNSFRYMLSGLATVLSVWLAWLVFGWVPVAGAIVWSAAVLVTWVIMTVGFGAAILSRAGVQPQFAGRYIPPEAMTDEYLWATPQFGVSAVARPEGFERKSKKKQADQ